MVKSSRVMRIYSTESELAIPDGSVDARSASTCASPRSVLARGRWIRGQIGPFEFAQALEPSKQPDESPHMRFGHLA